MVVPGLYGYVSATKWVVDLEVTRFQDKAAYWTSRGWSERGPVKMSSRIEAPRSFAQVPAGSVVFGGTAWAQPTHAENSKSKRPRIQHRTERPVGTDCSSRLRECDRVTQTAASSSMPEPKGTFAARGSAGEVSALLL